MTRKNTIKELFVYGVFGVLTTVVNIIVYQILLSRFILKYWICNLLALLFSKLFAYFVNKKFVFRSKCSSFIALCKEFFSFIAARGLTGLIDFFGLIMMVEFFHIDKILSKYLLQIIVIVLNYVFSKLFVFKKSGQRE